MKTIRQILLILLSEYTYNVNTNKVTTRLSQEEMAAFTRLFELLKPFKTVHELEQALIDTEIE